MPDFSQLIVKVIGDVSSFDKEFKKSQRLLESFSNTATSLGTRLSAAVTLPLVGLGTAALQAAGKMEQTQIAFKTMLGSSTAAEKHLKELKDFAAATPFEFEDVTRASRKMQALGFAAQDVLPNLRIIGDAAAGLGLGAEGIDRITLALGQMKAKGVVSAEEMRQLAEAGIPAWQILAKTLNTDVAGAMKMVEKRAVDSATAVPAIMAGMNAKFGGLMEAQSKTLLGQWSNFKDQMSFTLIEIGNTLAPTAKSMLDFLRGAGESAKLAATEFAKLPEPIKNTAIAITAFAAAAGPALLVVGQLAAALKSVREALPFVAAAAGVAAKAAGPLAAAAGAGYATSKAQSAAGVTVGAGIGGADPLGISKAVNAENAARKALTSTRLISNKVDQDALALSIRQTEAHKANGIEVGKFTQATNLLAAGKERASKATHVSTLAELVHAEIISRVKHATDDQIQSMLRLNAVASDPAILDAASYAYQYQNALKLATTETQMVEIATDAYRGGIFEVDAIMRQFGKTGPIALLQTENATRKALERMIELYKAGQATAAQVQAIAGVYAGAVKDRKQGGTDDPKKPSTQISNSRQPLLQVSTIVTDLGRGISDLIWKGGKFGDVMKNVGLEAGKSLTRNLLEKGLMKVGDYLIKMATKLIPGVGTALGGIFGGGSSAAAGAAGSAGGLGGGAASAASSIGGGLMGAVGAIGSIGSMVSGIIGNFQMHGIGKDTGRMEESLRGILNVLALNGAESIQSFAKASMYANIGVRDYWQNTGHTLLVKMTGALESMAGGGGMKAASAGGGLTVNVNIGSWYGSDPEGLDRLANDLGRRIKVAAGIR